MVLEKKKYPTESAGCGKILAAEYDNKDKKYQALLFFTTTLGHPGYYFRRREDGASARFLHSRLKFSATVTSHFSKVALPSDFEIVPSRTWAPTTAHR